MGWALEASRRARPARAWLFQAASWLLWLGAASAWAALALGLLAERAAPHVPDAWEALADHKALGCWTVGAFTALSAWRRWGRHERAFLAAWLAGVGLLLTTAYLGGEVVYRFGMGVTRR